MKLRRLLRAGAILGSAALALAAPSGAAVDSSLGRFFGAYTGCLVLHDIQRDEFLRVNPTQCQKRLAPGETFEIYLALAALETKTLESPKALLPWDGGRTSVADWNQDQSLASALKTGAPWFFEQLARKISAESMSRLLGDAPFGNCDTSTRPVWYWRNGGLIVSADEEEYFLSKLFRGQLAFRPEVQETVRELLVLSGDEQKILSGRAGTVIVDGKARVGWFVGRFRSPAGEYVFALNIEAPDRATGEHAREIAEMIFESRGLLR